MTGLYDSNQILYGGLPFDSHGVMTNPFKKNANRFSNYMSHLPMREQYIRQYRRNIMELLAARFTWKGLPIGSRPGDIPNFYLEKTLIEKGHAILFKPEGTNKIFAGGGSAVGYNHYGEPTQYNLISNTMENKTFDLYDDPVVYIKNNTTATSDFLAIELFIRTLAEIKVTNNINMEGLKTPFILSGGRTEQNTLLEQFSQISDGQTFLMVDKDFKNDGSSIEVFNTNVPYHIDKLQQMHEDYKAEMLEILGIETNPNPHKKERMIVDEVGTNKQEIAINRVTRLTERQSAAEYASELFGTKITVEINEVFDNDFLDGIDRLGHDDGPNSSMDKQQPIE